MQSKIQNLIVVATICLQVILPTATQAASYTISENQAAGFYTTINQAAPKCTVTKTADSGSGTLRQCLLTATAGTVIDFDPTQFQPTKPVSITVVSPLPIITVSDITIDGSNAGVTVDGSQLQRGDGLVIQGAQRVTIRGLAIRRFPQAGLVILGAAQNNVIGGSRATGVAQRGQGNLISNNGGGGLIIQDAGTTGNSVLGNDIVRNIGTGVHIRRLASQNTVGTDNVISGNGGPGVWISDANPADPLQSTSDNKVTGNYIGVDATGTISVTFGNGGTGVFISDGARRNIVGGPSSADRNVISNNGGAGVTINGTNSDQNQVAGNLIGIDVTGERALGNSVGVRIRSGAKQNVIGGATAGERNVISGNATGMFIWDPGTEQNKVIGNFIGTDLSGTKAVPNGADGINIGNGAQNNIIGGIGAGERNVISGNGDDGVVIQDENTDNNQIINNFIGTDVTGRLALSNINNGILLINGPSRTLIGGELAGAGNVISGNGYQGILIRDPGTTETKVIGNIIGLDETGMNRLDNRYNGILIFEGANNNLIGGEAQAARNIISSNGFNGVSILHLATSSNVLQGNFIGTDITGQTVQGNRRNGIFIGLGAQNNVIGSENNGAGNVISGNGDPTLDSIGSGLFLTEANRNRILGNYIGTDKTGIKRLGNKHDGITIVDQSSDNVIGAGNVIGNNGDSGVWLEGTGTRGNSVSGNQIGTDISGTGQFSNVNYGVYLGDGAISNTIGVSNTIVYNLVAGVAISGTTTTGNKITRNAIHSNQGGQIVWLTPNGINQALQLIGYSFPNLLSGQACAGCTVEVYANPQDTAAGALYLNTAIADGSGAFIVAVQPPPSFAYLSVLQILPDGTTSQFSTGLKIMTGFSLYMPLVRKDSGISNRQGEAAAAHALHPAALNQNAARVIAKSGRPDLLSGTEKQNAYTP